MAHEKIGILIFITIISFYFIHPQKILAEVTANTTITSDLQSIKQLGFKRIRVISYVRYSGDAFYDTWPGDVFISFPIPTQPELNKLKNYLQLVDQAGLQYEFVLLMPDSKNKYYTYNTTGQDYKNFIDALWPIIWTGRLDSISVGGDMSLNPDIIDTQNPDSFPAGKNVVDSHRQWLQEMWPYVNSKCPGCNLGVELLTGYAKFWDVGVGSLQWIRQNLNPLPKFVGVQYYPTTPAAMQSLGFQTLGNYDWTKAVDTWYTNLTVAAGNIPLLADEIGMGVNLGFSETDRTNFYRDTVTYLISKGIHFNVWEFADHPGIGLLGIKDQSRNPRPFASTVQQLLTPTLTSAYTAGAQYNPPESVGWQFIMQQTLVSSSFAISFKLGNLEGRNIPNNLPLLVTIIDSTGTNILSTKTLTPNDSNVYTLTFASSDPQRVKVRIKAAGYLSQLTNVIDTTISNPQFSISKLFAGDFNEDNVVNSLDYSQLNTQWNQNYPSTDINLDGLINSIDFAILKNNFGMVGQ